ncbi:MAG: peptidylprolyl isomerase [Gammaproteobacteria bacterium]|nr:peptidylprolyl isomerase [Gammaproteobacteria bacterium]
MQVAENKVVLFHYTLTNDAGETLDSSVGGDPLAYLHGFGNIIPGLEAALAGKTAGDKLNVRIEPENAYGVRQDALVQEIPLEFIQGIDNLEIGMQLQAQSEQGVQVFTIIALDDQNATLDGNHPLAGVHLTFDVEIAEVRDASGEELAHGHVHGVGGHHH